MRVDEIHESTLLETSKGAVLPDPLMCAVQGIESLELYFHIQRWNLPKSRMEVQCPRVAGILGARVSFFFPFSFLFYSGNTHTHTHNIPKQNPLICLD